MFSIIIQVLFFISTLGYTDEFVSMRSRLLDGMFCFLKHAPALEMFWPKRWIF